MPLVTLMLLLALAVIALPRIAVAGDETLSIGFDTKTARPNIFIAWRNTERILEVEVEVKNLGDRQASGTLAMAILDEEGRVLDRSPRVGDDLVRVVLPPAARGGREGKIVQMRGTKELNLLIDRLDRANERYLLRVDVVPDGSDQRAHSVVKSFNVSSKVRPAARHFYDHYIANSTTHTVDAVWHLDASPLPAGWRLESSIAPGQRLRLEPGQVVQGVLTVRTPDRLLEGDHLDVRGDAVNVETQEVIEQVEWYLVRDTRPPQISNAAVTVDEVSGQVRIEVTANDDSMLKEASGVRVEYSTDDGITFSNRVLAYLDGNFVGPTRFVADLGPFAPGARVSMTVLVSDIAGNQAKRVFEPFMIPRPKRAS